MITSAIVKQKAKEFGADLCGISPMSRFEGCPKQYDGRYIFPGAKSMIVLGLPHWHAACSAASKKEPIFLRIRLWATRP